MPNHTTSKPNQTILASVSNCICMSRVNALARTQNMLMSICYAIKFAVPTNLPHTKTSNRLTQGLCRHAHALDLERRNQHEINLKARHNQDEIKTKSRRYRDEIETKSRRHQDKSRRNHRKRLRNVTQTIHTVTQAATQSA